VHKPYAFKRGQQMNNFDRFILVVLVFNWVITAFQGNWGATVAWVAATCFLLEGAIKKEEEK
jgi:hypothetical protein